MKKFEKLLLSSINEDITGTTVERLIQVKNIFESEMLYQTKPLNRESITRRLQDWLQGLCSTVEIPFMNHDILAWYEKGLNRKIVPGVAERGKARAETLLHNYWIRCARTLYKMLYN